MGLYFCISSQLNCSNPFAGNEKEIIFSSYSSNHDKLFDKIERKYNLLTKLQLVEYVNLLENFSIQTATIPDEYPWKEKYHLSHHFMWVPLSSDEFQSFIENKIWKHSDIYAKAASNEERTNVFKDTMIELYKSWSMKNKQHYKDQNLTITKGNLLALGLLFCMSSNISKVKLLFDLFSDKGGKLRKSKEFDSFILTLFLWSSYSMLSALNKIGKISNIMTELPKLKMKEIWDYCEWKDIQEWLSVFDIKLFDVRTEIEYEEFKRKFTDKHESWGWIFCTKGIRKMLENHNV